ncbi:unnamed protein product [Ceutorhynchus assimilis]|uniref:Fatty acid desaturase domain-containing protein n=1 Tax=Ceutorhynchus assimilis TaxID=467358 RepID=A0A9N9QD21_9CUCU|nr:unnamed protein product [Ceutorhynchus assimilis]
MASCITENLSSALQFNENKNPKVTYKIVWSNVVLFTSLHLVGVYGCYLTIFAAKVDTIIYAFGLYMLSAFGITGGAHRLWSHRSYKAKLPLRIFLIICHTISYENSVIRWARDHRVHHKYQETEADPHNAKRGFFFSHIGWLLVKKHPAVEAKGKTIDMTDLYSDALVKFQHKYISILGVLMAIIIPTALPMLIWNETFKSAYSLNVFRILAGLHVTWLVNSAAHLYGNRPYDRNIGARQNSFVSFVGIGEGWHNFHHAFPWDYRASDFGTLNLTLHLLNFFARIGWAYDLKIATPDAVQRRCLRTGDSNENDF